MSADERDRKRRFYFAAIVDRADLSIGARLTYGALDTYADIDGVCNPSLDTLVARLGLKKHDGRRSVRRWLIELEKAGAITRIPGRGGAEPERTVYRLLVSWPTSVRPRPAPGQDRLPGIDGADPSGITPPPSGMRPQTQWRHAPKPSGAMPHKQTNRTNHRTNTPPTPPTALERVTPEVLPAPAPGGASDSFAAFWTAYPRKVARGRAETAWRHAARRDGPDTIAAGLTAWVAYWALEATAERFIPHPTTFLNQARYHDAPPPVAVAEPAGFAATRAYLEQTGGRP